MHFRSHQSSTAYWLARYRAGLAAHSYCSNQSDRSYLPCYLPYYVDLSCRSKTSKYWLGRISGCIGGFFWIPEIENVPFHVFLYLHIHLTRCKSSWTKQECNTLLISGRVCLAFPRNFPRQPHAISTEDDKSNIFQNLTGPELIQMT